MTTPDPEETILPDSAALLGLDLPAACVAGVRDALMALQAHWRLVEGASPASANAA